MISQPILAPVFRCLFVTAVVPLIALVFLLGASAAQAVTVVCGITTEIRECEPGDTNATGILNLDIPGGDPLGFNVVFLFGSANDIWGRVGPFDFPTVLTATAAATAVGAVLNTLPDIVTVGNNFPEGHFRVPFERTNIPPNSLLSADGVYDLVDDASWAVGTGGSFESESLIYAKFTVVPEPGTGLLLGLGFAGLGVAGRSRREESGRTA